jgi:hypothetical protein
MSADFRTHTYAAGRSPRMPRPRSGPVSSRTVDPRVWATALDLAQDNPKLIKILSRTTVTVADSRYRH